MKKISSNSRKKFGSIIYSSFSEFLEYVSAVCLRSSNDEASFSIFRTDAAHDNTLNFFGCRRRRKAFPIERFWRREMRMKRTSDPSLFPPLIDCWTVKWLKLPKNSITRIVIELGRFL